MEKLKKLNEPIAKIKARHSNGAHKIHPDEFSGLEPVLYLSKHSRVMLTMNIWTKAGHCNGALGTVVDLGYNAERQQLPLRLAWAMTIHKCQGLTLEKAWIMENVTGMTYVALSRVRNLSDLVLEPLTFERLQAAKKSPNLQYRLSEEQRLDRLSQKTLLKFSSNLGKESQGCTFTKKKPYTP